MVPTPHPPTAQKCNTLIACSLPCNSPAMPSLMKQHTPASKSDPTVAATAVILIMSPGALVVLLLRVASAPFPSDTSATSTRRLGNPTALHHVVTCDSYVRCFDPMLCTSTAACAPLMLQPNIICFYVVSGLLQVQMRVTLVELQRRRLVSSHPSRSALL